MEDLRLDILPKLRKMAANNNNGQKHLWNTLSDEELLKSASLYGRDCITGEQGYNLAAVMLLGKDDVIMDVAPAYVTDALLRRVNIDRYDDREIIKTNLIESYEHLMDFGRKHLPDKFFMEDDQRKSLRSIITREMIANTLIHREYTSSYQAKFVIGKERMYKEPEFDEGDVFRIIVPLNDRYEYDSNAAQSTTQTTQSDEKIPEQAIMELLKEEPNISQKQISERLGINYNTVKYYMKELREKGYLQRSGTNRKGYWIVK